MFAQLMKLVVAVHVTVTMSGCTPSFLSPKEIDRTIASQVPRPPVKSFTPASELIACLGRQLAAIDARRVIIAPGGSDYSGKTGVDIATLSRAVLNGVRANGGNIGVTALGQSSVAPNNGTRLSPEDVMRPTQPWGPAVQLPTMFFESTVTSADNFVSKQRSAGLSARDADGGLSESNSAQRVFLHFYLREAKTQLDFDVVDLEVVYQQASVAGDLGAYVTVIPEGKKRGAGLRVGMSAAMSESAEPAIRVAIESAVALMLADYFNVDITNNCPRAPAPAGERLRSKAKPPAIDQIADYWYTLTPETQVMQIQSELLSLGYDPGSIDGHPGTKTRSAIRRFERDRSLPATNGDATLQVFLEICRGRIARGEDIRQITTARAPGINGAMKLILPEPRALKVGTDLTARLISERSGFLTCYWGMPGGVQAVLPALDRRGSSISARRPASIPAPEDRLVLTDADQGDHYLHCVLTNVALAPRLPKELKPGQELPKMSSAMLAQNLRAAAGPDFVAQTTARFTVVR